MQYAVDGRGVTKPPEFIFQAGKLVNILYFKLQHLTVREMIEQCLYFRNVNGVWQKVQCEILLERELLNRKS